MRWAFDYYAPPPRGVEVTLAFQAGPSVLLSAVDFSYGIPAQLAGRYEPRPRACSRAASATVPSLRAGCGCRP